jgi:hypothetical protein
MYLYLCSEMPEYWTSTCFNDKNRAFVGLFLGVATSFLSSFYKRKNPPCWFSMRKKQQEGLQRAFGHRSVKCVKTWTCMTQQIRLDGVKSPRTACGLILPLQDD